MKQVNVKKLVLLNLPYTKSTFRQLAHRIKTTDSDGR